MLAPMEPTQSANRVNFRKRELRAAVLGAAAGADARAAAAATAAVLALPEVSGAGCVAAYASLGRELDTRPLLDQLQARGVRVLLPLLRADLGLDWGEYAGWDLLVDGPLGTRQPADADAALDAADVIIVPAVAVDRRGHRLGRGGGSYDRALSQRSPGTTVVAILADSGLVDDVPVEPHDAPVDVVVTPARVLRCGPPGV
jgi:5-formyltetrahydrofolate cyclo-ligase